MSLEVFLDGVPPRRRGAAVFAQLRDAIVEGRLGAGDRLPTTRELASDLGLSRSTVTTVYGRLVAEGYAVGRTGDGTFVADLPPADEATGLISDAFGHRAPPAAPPPGGWEVDLRTGRPDPDRFPLADWRRCVTGALQQPPPAYGDPAGRPELRRAVAAWVGRSRGLALAPDEVLVTAGAQGAFDLCARVLTTSGDVVAVEEPGYPPAWRAFERAGAVVAPVPVDEEGMVVALIPATARVVYVTPSHQAPTGVILSPTRRRELLALAAERDLVVVEDDYDTEYRYVDRPLEPLHRLDGGRRVLYVGSFSKTLSPSLRIGFVAAQRDVIDRLCDRRVDVDAQPPYLEQAALATFLANGGFERHLRRVRRVYRRRRDLLVALLADLADEGRIAGFGPCPAGLHTLVELLPGTDAEAVARELRSDGIGIESSDPLWRGIGEPGLVVGFGLVDEAGLQRFARRLRGRLG